MYRNKIIWAIGVVLIPLGGLLAYYNLGISSVSANVGSAVVLLQTDVSVKNPGESEFLPVHDRMIIKTGSVIKTSPQGRAALVYPNGTTTIIQEDTEVAILSLDELGSKIRLKLSSGSLWSKVLRLFRDDDFYEIETPSVVTSVRGTVFEVEHRNAVTQTTVLEDSVAVSTIGQAGDAGRVQAVSGQAVAVPEHSVFTDQAPLTPEALSKEKITTKAQELQTLEQRLEAPDIQKRIQAQTNAGIFSSGPLAMVHHAEEQVGNVLTFSNTRRADRRLTQAQERLNDIRDTIAEGNGQDVRQGIDAYQNALAQAIQSAKDTGRLDTLTNTARSVIDQQKQLTALTPQLSEDSRVAMKTIRQEVQDQSDDMLRTLAQQDPVQAVGLGVETINEPLSGARGDILNGAQADFAQKIEAYRQRINFAKHLAGSNLPLTVRVANRLDDNIENLQTLGILASGSSPDISKAIQTTQDQTVNEHAKEISDLVTRDPQRGTPLMVSALDRRFSHVVQYTRQGDQGKIVDSLRHYDSYLSVPSASSSVGIPTQTLVLPPEAAHIIAETTARQLPALQTALTLIGPGIQNQEAQQVIVHAQKAGQEPIQKNISPSTATPPSIAYPVLPIRPPTAPPYQPPGGSYPHQTPPGTSPVGMPPSNPSTSVYPATSHTPYPSVPPATPYPTPKPNVEPSHIPYPSVPGPTPYQTPYPTPYISHTPYPSAYPTPTPIHTPTSPTGTTPTPTSDHPTPTPTYPYTPTPLPSGGPTHTPTPTNYPTQTPTPTPNTSGVLFQSLIQSLLGNIWRLFK